MTKPSPITSSRDVADLDATSPSSSMLHEVELFGVPRLLAGHSRVEVHGATLGEIAHHLVQGTPGLGGSVLDQETGWPLPGYSFVVNERFTRDPLLSVTTATSILLVASAAGG